MAFHSVYMGFFPFDSEFRFALVAKPIPTVMALAHIRGYFGE